MDDFIGWSEIEFGNKSSGKHSFFCPKCKDSRKLKNKHKKPLRVDFDKGVCYCHNCHAKGFRDSASIVKDKNFVLPKQHWKNYTDLSESLVKWLESRGIHQRTAIELGWTMEQRWNAKFSRKENMLCFNRFERDIVVNKKFRTGLSKYFTQDSGGKSVFYNINAAIGQKELYIVEGEMDVASFYEVGIKNVVSLPNGANDSDDVWINSKEYLSDIELFIIGTDNDDAGRTVCQKIAHRLGKWKCKKITYRNKDANDDLMEGRHILLASIEGAEKFPVGGTHNSEDLASGLEDLYREGLPRTITPKGEDFKELNRIFSIMSGHLVIATGMPSHGKSNFVDWYCLNLVADHDMKLGVFSPEHHPIALHEATYIQKFYGKSFFRAYQGVPRISHEEIKKYNEWAKDKIYFVSCENGDFPTWDWFFDKMREMVYSFGINMFLIDAFNKLDTPASGSELQAIKKVLTKLTMFTQMHDVIIFLVAHPTKMKKNSEGLYETPTLYDVSGSADFRNMTHDGFCIYRFFKNEEHEGYTRFVNLKTKMSFQGEIGQMVDFEYHLPSGRFYPRGGNPSTHCLIDKKDQADTYDEDIPRMHPGHDMWDSKDKITQGKIPF